MAASFPISVAAVRDLSDEECGVVEEKNDPAAELRVSDKLTSTAMLKAFDDPLLSAVASFGMRFNFSRWSDVAALAIHGLLTMALLGLAWAWSDGRLFAVGPMAATIIWAFLIFSTATGMFGVYVAAMPPSELLMDGHVAARLFRWLRMVGRSEETPPKLICHEMGDSMCTCPTCMGTYNAMQPGWR
jgi:hypothetical protein